MANKNVVLKLLITAKDEASGVLTSMQEAMTACVPPLPALPPPETSGQPTPAGMFGRK